MAAREARPAEVPCGMGKWPVPGQLAMWSTTHAVAMAHFLHVILTFFSFDRCVYLWGLQWRSDPGRYLEVESADFSMGKAPGYHARARLFSLCSCYTSKFLFSYLLYVVADDKGDLFRDISKKKDSDISKPWIKNVFLKLSSKASSCEKKRKPIVFRFISINVKGMLCVAFRPERQCPGSFPGVAEQFYPMMLHLWRSC